MSRSALHVIRCRRKFSSLYYIQPNLPSFNVRCRVSPPKFKSVLHLFRQRDNNMMSKRPKRSCPRKIALASSNKLNLFIWLAFLLVYPLQNLLFSLGRPICHAATDSAHLDGTISRPCTTIAYQVLPLSAKHIRSRLRTSYFHIDFGSRCVSISRNVVKGLVLVSFVSLSFLHEETRQA